MLLQACSLVQSPEFDNPVDEKYNPPPKEVIAERNQDFTWTVSWKQDNIDKLLYRRNKVESTFELVAPISKDIRTIAVEFDVVNDEADLFLMNVNDRSSSVPLRANSDTLRVHSNYEAPVIVSATVSGLDLRLEWNNPYNFSDNIIIEEWKNGQLYQEIEIVASTPSFYMIQIQDLFVQTYRIKRVGARFTTPFTDFELNPVDVLPAGTPVYFYIYLQNLTQPITGITLNGSYEHPELTIDNVVFVKNEYKQFKAENGSFSTTWVNVTNPIETSPEMPVLQLYSTMNTVKNAYNLEFILNESKVISTENSSLSLNPNTLSYETKLFSKY